MSSWQGSPQLDEAGRRYLVSHLTSMMNERLDVQMDTIEIDLMQVIVIIICGSSRRGGLPRGGALAGNG